MGNGVKKPRREQGKHYTMNSKPANDLPTIQGQLFWLDQCGQWIGVWAVLKGHALTRSPVDTPLNTSGNRYDQLCQPETIDVRTWSLSYNEEAYGRKHCFELMRSDRRFGRRRCEMFSTKSEGEIRIWLHRLKYVMVTSTNMFQTRIMARSLKDNIIRNKEKEADIDNDIIKKILEDRNRLRQRSKEINMRKYSDRDFQVNEISYNPSGNYKNENARKQVIEEKLIEISKCIDGDTSNELKEKLEDLRFELDELDIKLSQTPCRKRGSVEKRTESNSNVSFKNETNLTEIKRRSLLKSHALAFNSAASVGGNNLKRAISLGGAHNTISHYTSNKVQIHKNVEIIENKDEVDHENLKYLENINNFEKLLNKMQTSEFTKF